MFRARRLLPPDGPRYELFDTSAAVCWIALVSYVIFPPPQVSIHAVGAPLRIVTETQLGVVLAIMTALGCLGAYLRSRLILVPWWTRRQGWHRRLVWLNTARMGYRVSRIACLYMAINFGLTALIFASDLYLPHELLGVSLQWLHHRPPVPHDDAVLTLRSALIFVMIYGYAFRRLQRDNRDY